MYNQFFGFRERPFKLVPNPDYLYLSRSHEEALAHLQYAVAQAEGFVEITGEVGTGKTMLCRAFLENMIPDVKSAYIFNPAVSANDLMRSINSEFGIRSDSADTKKLIDELNHFLMKIKAEGKRAVLIIDEAQNLSGEVLEQLRLLSNLETIREKLLQIILVGQPELSRILNSYKLRQLGQRISLSCSIAPLPFKETREYINHRVHVASFTPRVFFTRRAVRKIYRYSRGIPRLINIACDRSLLVAYTRNTHKITGRAASFAITELSERGHAPSGHKKPSPAAVFMLTALAAALAVLVFYETRGFNVSRPLEAARDSKTASESNPFKTKRSVKLSFDIPDTDAGSVIRSLSPASFTSAVSHILSIWRNDINMPDSDPEDSEAYIKEAAENHGLELYRVKKDLSLIRNLRLPAVFSFEHPDTVNNVYLAALNIGPEKITFFIPETGEKLKVPAELIGAFWNGDAYVIWNNFRDINGVIGKNADADSVAGLQMLLKTVGKSDVTVNGTYDEKTRIAIKQIQAGQGIPVDGHAGAATKIVLYRLAGFTELPGT